MIEVVQDVEGVEEKSKRGRHRDPVFSLLLDHLDTLDNLDHLSSVVEVSTGDDRLQVCRRGVHVHEIVLRLVERHAEDGVH